MATTGARAEFKRSLAEIAADLRRRVEQEVIGLDPSPRAVADRREMALASDGFEFFARTYFPHYIRSRELSRLHDYLFERLCVVANDPVGQNEAIAAPRGEAKSTLCSQLYPLWQTARKTKKYILIGMDASDQASIMIEAIKAELEANPRLAMDFPEICGVGRVWREGLIVTSSGVKIEGLGSGKKLRGRRHGPHRPDLVILDDIENDENVRSPEQRDRLEGWVDKAVLNVGAADGTLDVIYIGTILHYDLVLARKMKNPLWHSRKFASVIRWPDRMDLWERWEESLRNDGPDAADQFYAGHLVEMLAGSEVSWPGVRPLVSLMKLRVKIGRAAFDAEQQNDPISEADSLFPVVHFWVNRLPEWVFYGACDPSLGKANKGRDPSAILVGGINRETGILDVVEGRIRRRLPDLIIAHIIELQREYACLKWAIESVQFQEFFRTELVKRSAKDGVPVPAVPVNPSKDKSLRIESLQPHVANGLIRVHPSLTTLIEQLRHYPMADHDDGPDALEMLWKIAMTPKAAGATANDPDARADGHTARRESRRMFRRAG